MTALERVGAEVERLSALQERISASGVPGPSFGEWLGEVVSALGGCEPVTADRERILVSVAASVVLKLEEIEVEDGLIARGLERAA